MIRAVKTVYVAVLLLPSFTFAQADSSATLYVGRAGNIYISEREFLDRFEMLPALYRHRKPHLDVAKMELMYSLIAEKLLTQEAQTRKLDQDSLFAAAILEIRKLLARDQLYREEVTKKVEVSPEELVQGIREAQKQVLVAFMFFDQEAEAKFGREQIKKPADFDGLAIDSSMYMLRDTATVIWGDAKKEIEEAAYRLMVGEVSPVVQAGEGYYILKCSTISSNPSYSSMSPGALRDRVARLIRERKEKVRMDEFLSTAFRGKMGYPRLDQLKTLARVLMDVYEQTAGPRDSTIGMNSERSVLVRKAVGSILLDTLVVAGNTIWTMDEVIGRLLAQGFEIRRENIKKIPARLNIDIGFWVQQELLGQEGIARKLDQLPEMQQQIEMWSQVYLADMMKGYARQHVSVTDEEVWKYLENQDKQTPIPQVQIRELRTSSLDEMKLALDDLQRGISFERVIETRSNDAEAKRNKGLTHPFLITDRSPFGGIAWQMDIGQRYGPVRLDGGIYYFELVSKKADPVLADTSFAARKEKADKELLAMKQKRTITLFISQVAEKRGFEIYQDRLLKLNVMPIPMMTFRFLGFGGRMFEVPFVDPQLQWLDVEPPKETVLP